MTELLKSGARPVISEREFSEFWGRSTSTLQKMRCKGKGPPFIKDPDTGRISYSAEAVLRFVARGRECRSTSDYDNTELQERVEKAREAKRSKRKQIDSQQG